MSFIFPSNEILKCYGVTALWRQSYLRGKKTIIFAKKLSFDVTFLLSLRLSR